MRCRSDIIIVPFGTLYPRCTLVINLSFLFQKKLISRLRFINQFRNSVWYIFFQKNKKIVLQYIRRVVLVPFSKKKYQPLRQIISPTAQFPHQKWQRAAAKLFRRRRRGRRRRWQGGGQRRRFARLASGPGH